ncbi:MAG: type II secretion system F family protein [Kangiellaceae bacterium]
MPNFQYTAVLASGKSSQGVMDAADEEAVADRLLSSGATPISVKEAENASGLMQKDLGDIFQVKTVQLQDIVMFSRQMFSLTKAGIPLTRAINGLKESSSSKPLKTALEAIHSDLNSGTNLATAFSRHPNVFSELYVSLIHVGENSGRLEEAFLQIARYLELEQETSQRIKSATRYPVIVLTLIMAALFIINIFVLPEFAKMFSAFNAGELPLATRMLMATSNFFVNYWPHVFILGIMIYFAIQYYLKTSKGALLWDEQKLKLPIFGSIIYRSLLSRFSRTFAMMSRSGMPLISSLNITGRVVDNHWVAGHIINMRDGVERGESISQVAQRTELFSPLILQMINVGEETGQLDNMLDEVADFYENQVDYDLKKVSDYIEPVLIVFIGIVVLILALGVYLPMWDLASSANSG